MRPVKYVTRPVKFPSQICDPNPNPNPIPTLLLLLLCVYRALSFTSGCVYVWKFHRADLEAAAYSGHSHHRPSSSSSALSGMLSGTGGNAGAGAGAGGWDDDDAMTHATHTTGGMSLTPSLYSHATGATHTLTISTPTHPHTPNPPYNTPSHS